LKGAAAAIQKNYVPALYYRKIDRISERDMIHSKNMLRISCNL
jgi:hypothetical protein